MRPEEFYKNKFTDDCKKAIHWLEVDSRNKITELIKKVAQDIFPTCKLHEDKNVHDFSAEDTIDIVYSKSRFIKDSGVIDHTFYVNDTLVVFMDTFLYYPEITSLASEETNGVITFEAEYMREQTKHLNMKVNELQKQKIKAYNSLNKMLSDIQGLQASDIPRIHEKFIKLQQHYAIA